MKKGKSESLSTLIIRLILCTIVIVPLTILVGCAKKETDEGFVSETLVPINQVTNSNSAGEDEAIESYMQGLGVTYVASYVDLNSDSEEENLEEEYAIVYPFDTEEYPQFYSVLTREYILYLWFDSTGEVFEIAREER